MDKHVDLNRIAVNRIKAAMAVENVSQSELANRLNVSVDTVRRRLNEETPLTLDEISAYSSALNVPLAEFIGGKKRSIKITTFDFDVHQGIC